MSGQKSSRQNHALICLFVALLLSAVNSGTILLVKDRLQRIEKRGMEMLSMIESITLRRWRWRIVSGGR